MGRLISNLSPKQDKFCQLVADGKTYSDAYRSVYNSENMKPETVNRKAYELFCNGKITARIEEIKKALEDLSLWTREDSVRALKSVIENPDKPSDIVAATKELNAMHGYNAPKKFEQIGPDGKPIGAMMPTVIKIVGV